MHSSLRKRPARCWFYFLLILVLSFRRPILLSRAIKKNQTRKRDEKVNFYKIDIFRFTLITDDIMPTFGWQVKHVFYPYLMHADIPQREVDRSLSHPWQIHCGLLSLRRLATCMPSVSAKRPILNKGRLTLQDMVHKLDFILIIKFHHRFREIFQYFFWSACRRIIADEIL